MIVVCLDDWEHLTDDFSFQIVNFQFLSSKIPAAPANLFLLDMKLQCVRFLSWYLLKQCRFHATSHNAVEQTNVIFQLNNNLILMFFSELVSEHNFYWNKDYNTNQTFESIWPRMCPRSQIYPFLSFVYMSFGNWLADVMSVLSSNGCEWISFFLFNILFFLFMLTS